MTKRAMEYLLHLTQVTPGGIGFSEFEKGETRAHNLETQPVIDPSAPGIYRDG